jgi:NAD(P)-dependent dehydrogenase (short-subunit alcohol dehydrogenase family)
MLCARDAALIETRRREIAKMAAADVVDAVAADVSDEGAVQRLVESTLARFDGPHILANNAGI